MMSRRNAVFWVFVILFLRVDECLSLNDEGLDLLEFRTTVNTNPQDAFKNWNYMDNDPCGWSGVHCIDGKVVTLNLKELSLGGKLLPKPGRLSYLRSLILYKNNFSGFVPKEIQKLTLLEVLDLRGNKLSGINPTEFGEMPSSHEHFSLYNDKEFSTTSVKELDRLVVDTDCNNRKVKSCQQIPLLQLKSNSYADPIKGRGPSFLDKLPWLKFRKFSLSHAHGEPDGFSFPSFPHTSYAQRKLIQESGNLAAVPVRWPQSTLQEFVAVPSTGSGSFSAFPSGGQSPSFQPKDSKSEITSHSSDIIRVNHDDMFHGHLKIIVIMLSIAVIFATFIVSMVIWRSRQGPAMIGPWKTGLSGPLQKAFVAGVPKLNRCELEAACEDFSNIVATYSSCTVYKGTLSSGVEVAVISTAVSYKDWSKRSEAYFRKKVDTLSRINHKNFTNLLGFCEENDPLPFTRMIVVEYSPNGNLYEHLHGKEFEPLDWNSRMRILTGTAYCLQYLHHDISPPVNLGDLQSKSIYLTDDYAAKVCDRNMWSELAERKNRSMGEDFDPSESAHVDIECNVYGFGIIMLEIISGRLPHSEEEGSILNWATEYLNDKRNFKNLVDPALKSFKNNELDIVCETIQECLHGDPKDRPKMKEVAAKLGVGLGISPEAASPRLSPLWWAELEILSVS